MIAAPHINASLPAGTLLSADNIEMRPVPLKFVESAGVPRLEDVVGKTLVRQSRQGPMTLTVKGQAVTGAAAGGLVQVINLMSKRVISARAISAGAVEVSADPLALAGL